MAARAGFSARWLLPLSWGAATALVMWFGALEAPSRGRVSPEFSEHATYYVVAHSHYVLSIGLAFAAFALIYVLLSGLFDRPPHRWLGYLHLFVMAAGVALIFSPQYLLRFSSPRRGVDVDPVAMFAQLNRLSSAGYLVSLASLIVFAAVLFDSFKARAA